VFRSTVHAGKMFNRDSLNFSCCEDSLINVCFQNEPSGVVFGGGHVYSRLCFNLYGYIAPGHSPGILSVDGSAAFSASTIYNAEILGPAPGTGYDVLDVSDTVALAGTVNLI